MERRQNTGERCKIVQDFLLTIKDDAERTVCYMYLHNYRDVAVRKQLKISQRRLDEIKAELRRRLIAAGIRVNSSE